MNTHTPTVLPSSRRAIVRPFHATDFVLPVVAHSLICSKYGIFNAMSNNKIRRRRLCAIVVRRQQFCTLKKTQARIKYRILSARRLWFRLPTHARTHACFQSIRGNRRQINVATCMRRTYLPHHSAPKTDMYISAWTGCLCTSHPHTPTYAGTDIPSQPSHAPTRPHTRQTKMEKPLNEINAHKRHEPTSARCGDFSFSLVYCIHITAASLFLTYNYHLHMMRYMMWCDVLFVWLGLAWLGLGRLGSALASWHIHYI